MEWLEGLLIFATGWIACWFYMNINKHDDDDHQGAGEQNYNYGT